MTVSRRHVLAAAPAVLAASALRAAPNDFRAAYFAKRGILIRQLFEQLREPPAVWRIDPLLHDVVTLIDLSRAFDGPMGGEVRGKPQVIERLIQLSKAGELDLAEPPSETNVADADDLAIYASARRGGAPIAYGVRAEHSSDDYSTLQVSILTVIRPFEHSYHPVTQCDLDNFNKRHG